MTASRLLLTALAVVGAASTAESLVAQTAASDEDRSTVEQFLAKNHCIFPVALDPGRKVNTAFSAGDRRKRPSSTENPLPDTSVI